MKLGHKRLSVALGQAEGRIEPRRVLKSRQRADHGRVEPGLARVWLLERLGRTGARDQRAEAESLRLRRRRGEAEREAERARRNRPSGLDPHLTAQGRHLCRCKAARAEPAVISPRWRNLSSNTRPAPAYGLPKAACRKHTDEIC